MPIPVFLDSSALRALDPTSVLAAVVRELTAVGTLAVHLPALVEEEVVGGIEEALKPPGRDVNIAFAWASQAGTIERTAYSQMRRMYADARANVAAGVRSWLDSLGTTRHQGTAPIFDAAMRAYFAGAPPFGSKRARADIPDAIIFETIRQFAGTTKGTHAVVIDDRLARALEELKVITVHRRWSGLLRDGAGAIPGQTIFKALWSVHEAKIRKRLEEVIEGRVDFLEIESAAFPSDGNDATITQVGSIDDIELDAAAAEMLTTQDTLTVPFTCEVTDNVADLFVYKGEFWSMDDDRFHLTKAEWNDHFVAAQTSVDLALRGTALITIRVQDDVVTGFEDVDIVDLDEVTVTKPRLADS